MGDTTIAEARPRLTRDLPSAEFERWYWLKEELIAFARDLSLATSGSKAALAERIAATLAGAPARHAARPTRGGGPQLAGELTAATVIPRGQRCSQALRAWFTHEVGPGFHFDHAMRDFFAQADGTQTLGDALDHYWLTRGAERADIAPQFEYNRFTRAWHAAHPRGSRSELLTAWHEYRSRPVDVRGRA